MTLLVFIHFMVILAIFNRVHIIPYKPADNIWQIRLGMLIVLLPIFVLLSILIKKRDLEAMSTYYEDVPDKIFKANVSLIAYIILFFALLMIIAIARK